MKNLANIKIYCLLAFLSAGKVISSAGQTLFGMLQGFSYCFRLTGNARHPFHIAFSLFFALCTCWVVCITRVPAIQRQIMHYAPNRYVRKKLPGQKTSVVKWVLYYVLLFASLSSGFFSSVGAYLGTFTLIEMFTHVFDIGSSNASVKHVLLHSLAVIIAISTYATYYSFNYYKSKENITKLIFLNRFSFQTFVINKAVLKTFGVSFLSMVSIPFFAYFLTKHAFYKMPYITTWLAPLTIQYIAGISSITALVANITTLVPAMHEYFNEPVQVAKIDLDNKTYRQLRYITYFAGFFDCFANGLNNFLGVIEMAKDVFGISPYGKIVFLALGSGISSGLLNGAFSIRQGFNDFVKMQYAPLATSDVMVEEMQ